MKESISILLVDKNVRTHQFISGLSSSRCQLHLHPVTDRTALTAALHCQQFDCIVMNDTTLDVEVSAAVQLAANHDGATPVIVYAESFDEIKKREWMTAGAFAVVCPAEQERLLPVILSAAGKEHTYPKPAPLPDRPVESGNEFHAVFEALPDAVLVVRSPDGIITDVNSGFLTWFGFTREEVLGSSMDGLHLFDDTLDFHGLKTTLEESSGTIFREVRCTLKDHSVFIGCVSARLIHMQTEEQVFILLQNITERNKIACALQEGERTKTELLEKLNEAQHMAMIGSWEWDLTSNKIWWSDETYNIFGFPQKDFIPSFEENGKFIHPGDFTVYVQAFERALRTGEPVDIEVRLISHDGRIKYCHARGTVHFDVANRPVRFTGTLMDISERKQSEAVLHEREEQYKAIFKNTGTASVLIEDDTTLSLVNGEFERLSGYSREEIEGKMSWTSFVVPEDLERMRIQHKLRRKNRESALRQYEFRFLNRSGDVRTMLLTVDVIPGTKRSIASLLDITERINAEKKLSSSEDLFRAFIDESFEGVVIIDESGMVQEWNQHMYSLTGIPKPEAVGQQWIDILFQILPPARQTPEEQLWMRMLFKTIVEQGIPQTWQTSSYSMIDRAGREKIIQQSLFTFKTMKGIRLAGVLQDITSRKAIENALRDSEERYRQLVEYSPDAIIVHSEGIVKYVNTAAIKLLGASAASDLIGKWMMDFIHPMHKDVVRQHMLQYHSDHAVQPAVEGKYLKIGGVAIDVEVTALSIIFGKQKAVQIIVRDITEQKKLRDQLLQSQKMEAIGRLAGGVAHDFNNMISIILGYSSLLENKFPQSHPAYTNIRSITRAAEEASHITRQLLAFARKQTIVPIPLDLNKELMSLRQLLEKLIGEDIQLEVHVQDSLWTIKIDPTQLTQIVTNLATNARDAIENTGTITIESCNITIEGTSPVTMSEIPNGEYVSLVFADTGKGMNETVKKQIFEPFFTTKSVGAGTGLGLATVFGIVHQNNGYIHVYSEPDHGTVFKLYFPRYDGAAEILSSAEEPAVLTGNESLLVVEDEEDLLKFITTSLQELGYAVVGTCSPVEALAACTANHDPFDLLLSDVVMPDMNGKELQEQVCRLYPQIKTIFMSGYTSDIVAHRGILNQDVNFLEKPFTTRLLAKKIREVLNKNL